MAEIEGKPQPKNRHKDKSLNERAKKSRNKHKTTTSYINISVLLVGYMLRNMIKGRLWMGYAFKTYT